MINQAIDAHVQSVVARLTALWHRLQPQVSDRLTQARASLVTATCLSLDMAIGGMVFVWFVSGDLWWLTAVAAVLLVGVLTGLILLVRRGRVLAALWGLIGLLCFLISALVWTYGTGTSECVAYAIPVVLAAASLGLKIGVGVAAFASLIIWSAAIAGVAGWYVPFNPPDISALTFSAPAYTVILMMLAGIIGLWSRYIYRR